MGNSKVRDNSSLKMYAMLLLPLVIISGIVCILMAKGLKGNSRALTHALAVDSQINEIVALSIEQEDITKELLLDPDRFASLSERKIDAYDKHLSILANLRKNALSKAIRGVSKNSSSS